ncbi:MAG: respiratory chain complex I subunit 1 family protein [Acidiferrobacter sp.]
MKPHNILLQLMQFVLVVASAPLLSGWVAQCRAWLTNRQGAGPLQPYRVLRRLFNKDPVVAHEASLLFRITPYIVFGGMCLAGTIVPMFSTGLPFAPVADAIALVGIFAFARIFTALAAMDIGTAFGSMGARREMLVGFLAEPALLMVLFTPALISHSTSLTVIVAHLTTAKLVLYPSMAFAAAAYVMVLLAENARIPVDNPDTHLELTMIHGALNLEYSGRYLALIEWASAIKLLAYITIGIALFAPWGIARNGGWSDLPFTLTIFAIKVMAAGFMLAFLEALLAKMRLFHVPEFLGTAFMLAVVGLLVHFLLGA